MSIGVLIVEDEPEFLNRFSQAVLSQANPHRRDSCWRLAHRPDSSHTGVSQVKSVYRKLAVDSRGEAIFEAGQLGLL